MNKFDLTAMAARTRKSRRPLDLAPIRTTKVQRDDLLRVYLRMLAPIDSAAATVGAIYERELTRVLQTDSPDDLAASVDGIAAQIDRLVLQLTPELRDWAFRTERWHRGKWLRSILSAVTVDLSTMVGVEEVQETIAAFLQRNVSLVKDVSDQARGRIADAVFRGFQQRSPAREVAKEISEAVGMARARARRIASHQTVQLAASLDAQRQRQAGLDVWRWRHSGKQNPRPEHVARDENLYSDNPDRIGKIVGGKTIKREPEDEPGELPACGCVRQAVLVFDDD